MTDAPKPDRHAKGYVPGFDIDYEVGHQGELFVLDIIEGLKSERIEVKTDEKSQKTGNVYIEYRCRKNGEYVRSGIAETEATMWVFVLERGDLAVAVSTKRLLELATVAFRAGRLAECRGGSHPTRGVLISIADLVGAGTHARRGRGAA